MYDLIILGAGPAGTAAGVYAARKKLKTLLITEEFGGQSVVSETIYNWIGDAEIAGNDLAKKFKEHLEYYNDGETLTLQSGARATEILKNEDETFTIKNSKGESFQTKTVFIATGFWLPKKLNIPNNDHKDVITSVEFLAKSRDYTRGIAPMPDIHENVIVIGGGDVSFDVARTLVRLQNEKYGYNHVQFVARKSEEY